MNNKLYVGNLAYETTQDQIQSLFEESGTVNEVNLIIDRLTGRSKGFAFVTMATNEEASHAINSLNGKEFNDRKLTVNEARPMAPKSNDRQFNRR